MMVGSFLTCPALPGTEPFSFGVRRSWTCTQKKRSSKPGLKVSHPFVAGTYGSTNAWGAYSVLRRTSWNVSHKGRAILTRSGLSIACSSCLYKAEAPLPFNHHHHPQLRKWLHCGPLAQLKPPGRVIDRVKRDFWV